MREIAYNRAAAVDYAFNWALSRNPAFFNFDEIGGDCTNFISQCLFWGSGTMNFTPIVGWFYRSVADRTASWTGVEYLYNFLTTNQSFGPFAREVLGTQIVPGDVIQLGNSVGEFYHSLIVLQIFPEILVAAHSDDSLNRPLSSYNFYTARYLHIDGVRVR